MQIKSKKFKECPAFILRSLTMADAADITVNINNPKVICYLSGHLPSPYRLKDAKTFLKTILPQYRKPYRTRTDFVMGIEINGEICGGIGLHRISYGHKATLGYWLAEKHWNKGIMKWAVHLFLLRFAKKFSLVRIEAKIAAPNEISGKVLRFCDFKEEARLSKDFKRGNMVCDSILYANIDPY